MRTTSSLIEETRGATLDAEHAEHPREAWSARACHRLKVRGIRHADEVIKLHIGQTHQILHILQGELVTARLQCFGKFEAEQLRSRRWP